MIRLENVSKKFDHRGLAGINGVDLQIHKGEILAIMGPNGSGKTTLLNIVSGKLTPDSGTVSFTEIGHILKLETPDTDANVQKYLVSKVNLDIEEEKKVQLARDLADIFEFTFQLRQNISQLSAGQHQKIMLAGELMNKPSVILMDEPFAHLDPFTRLDILNAFFKYIHLQETSVIWVTHEIDEALKFSHRMVMMNFGKIVQSGNPEEILFQPKNLFVAQFLGYKNFITITFEDGKWKTPWGVWEKKNPWLHVEAIMVIPQSSWELKHGKKAQFQGKTLKTQGWEIEFSQENHTFWLQTSSSLSQLSDDFLTQPRFSECILLPL